MALFTPLPASSSARPATHSSSLCSVVAWLFSSHLQGAPSSLFPAEAVQEFKQHLVTRVLPKGGILMLDDEASAKLFYLRSGLARIFYCNAEGKDITSWFIGENEFFLPISAKPRPAGCPEYIELLERAELITLCTKQLETLYQSHPELNLFERLLKEKMLARCEARIRFLQIPKAQDRLRDFEQKHASLVARVPLKHIASYLNLTPSTLSRLRAQIT